ncbi:hypothetical protein FACS1894206_02830 [Deltaproteobacteria bacterium]|nr:hypothetical protein FACS1894206_02830 [Deltaproteobacteria bacterium]
MSQIETLLSGMQAPSDERMCAAGYALWMNWNGEKSAVVSQLMREYGGCSLAAGEEQEILFFFSSNVFLAAARIEVWSRFDATLLTIVIMPATLHMGGARNFRLDIADGMGKQSLSAPETFSIWIHPDASRAANSIPGLTLTEKPCPSGLAQAAWGLLQVDTRMPYTASLAWYAILRPLGNPLDKEFQNGWRSLFEKVEEILQRNKFRYTIHDFFLMFPLEHINQLTIWIQTYLELIAELKANNPGAYWPCVLAVVNKKGLTFNNDLPHKTGLDWNQLAADHPYMSFRNALILGPDFSLHEVRFALGNGPDDWCNVSLVSEEGGKPSPIPMLTPPSLALGSNPVCFYCGQRSHTLNECPTRILPDRNADTWRRVASLDFATMKEGIRSLDEAVKAKGLENVPEILAGDDAKAVMGRAVFDITHPCQLRCISRFWRTRGKGSGIDSELLETDAHPIWELLGNYAKTEDKGAFERSLQNLFPRFPRDFRFKTLLGFIALERGDTQKAALLWKDAETMAPAGLPQAWHLTLQGRVEECYGKINYAALLYDQAARACPQWTYPQYRKIVCQVKTGFTDTAIIQLSPLLELDANYFNMSILDSEMERGQIQVLTGLGVMWNKIEEQMKDEAPLLERLNKEISMWFTPDHPFASKAAERIKRLQEITRFHNYVPYMAALQGRIALERDMQQIVSRDSRDFRSQFKGYLDKLAYIQREAAWFPFPRVMVEFNKNYNQCAASLNWAMSSNLHTPEAFRRALIMSTEEEERIKNLENRLKFLRLIRDITLFFLTLAKTFFWLEAVGLLLVLVVLPLLLYYAQKTGTQWPLDALVGQQWQVQKAATLIISLASLAIAALRTVLRFEKIRDGLLEKARRADKEKQQKRREALARRKNK